MYIANCNLHVMRVLPCKAMVIELLNTDTRNDKTIANISDLETIRM